LIANESPARPRPAIAGTRGDMSRPGPNDSINAPTGSVFFEPTSMETKNSIRRRPRDVPALSGLRFVAAAYVVLFHTWPVFLPSHPGPLYWNQFVSLGYIAVSFFFVLSGFILATVYPATLNSMPLEKRAFWQARFARIYPIYAISMVLACPFVLATASWHSRAYQLPRMVFLTISNGSLLQAWHPILSGNWNRPTWSVSVEAFFYLIFPLAAGWVVRCRRHLPALIGGLWLMSLFSSAVVITLFHRLSATLPQVEIFLFNPLLRLPEFLVGVSFAAWLAQDPRVRPVPAWTSAMLCLMLIPLMVRLPWLLVSNGLLAPVFGMAIAHISRSRGIFAHLLEHPLLVRLGHASFSLYLLHLPVLLWMTYIMSKGTAVERLTRPWPGRKDSPIYFCLYWMLVVALSLLSYSFVETPARRAIRIWFGSYNRLSGQSDRATSKPSIRPEGLYHSSDLTSTH
jgi:peptidoglycan/LPS O-acetylase OafA/YrhL